MQLTPPGSACSIAIGEGLGGTLEPGTLDVIQVVIRDADAVLAQLRAKGVEAEGVDEQAWGRFITLQDPDGNRWTLQRLPDYSARPPRADERMPRGSPLRRFTRLEPVGAYGVGQNLGRLLGRQVGHQQFEQP